MVRTGTGTVRLCINNDVPEPHYLAALQFEVPGMHREEIQKMHLDIEGGRPKSNLDYDDVSQGTQDAVSHHRGKVFYICHRIIWLLLLWMSLNFREQYNELFVDTADNDASWIADIYGVTSRPRVSLSGGGGMDGGLKQKGDYYYPKVGVWRKYRGSNTGKGGVLDTIGQLNEFGTVTNRRRSCLFLHWVSFDLTTTASKTRYIMC
jgi:hypothetical protein